MLVRLGLGRQWLFCWETREKCGKLHRSQKRQHFSAQIATIIDLITIHRIQSPIRRNFCETPIGASLLCAPWEIRCMAASKAPWSMGLDTLGQPFKLGHFSVKTCVVHAPMLSGICESWNIVKYHELLWRRMNSQYLQQCVLLGFESIWT